MKANAPHVAFNRGEVCKEGLSRIDVDKMQLAAACQVNWMPWTVGTMQLRPGMQYVSGTKSDAKAKLVRFVFAKDDTAQFELTDSVMRVRVDDVLVSRTAVATTVASGAMTTAPSTTSAALNLDVAGWGSFTGRQVIKGTDLTAGTQVTVTLQATTSQTFQFSHVYIGKKASTQSFASTPVQLTFNGAVAGTVPAGGTLTSDPAAITIDGATDYVVSWYCSGSSVTATAKELASRSGWQCYRRAGDSAATVSVTGYSTNSPGGNGVALVSAVTVYGGSSGDWDVTGTTSGCTAQVTGGVMLLTCTAIGGLAQAKQALTIASADQGVEHGLRVTVTEGPVTCRVGSVDGLDDLVPQTALDVGTHSLAFTPTTGNAYLQFESTDAWPKTLTGAQIESAGTLELPTPWTAGDLSSVRYDQSADVVFVACVGLRQRKIERRSVRGWSVVEYRSNYGPFNIEPLRASTALTPSATVGRVTVAASLPVFKSSHVGMLLRLFSPGQTLGQTVGAADAWTPAIRVQGVGNQRNFNFVLSGNYTGTLTVQQSFDGPDSGWVDVNGAGGSQVGSGAVSATLAQNTGGTRLDNVIVWYRAGFHAGSYTSGSCAVTTNFTGGGAYGVGRIVSFYDPKTVIVDVISAFSSTAATTNWVSQQWNDDDGYPSAVVFNEGRLGWFGTSTWLSESDDFYSFANIDSTGADLGDSGAINEQFGSGPVDVIPWALSASRLLIGRELSIGSARSSALDSPLTPTDIVIKDCSTQGAARLPAVKVGANGIFVQGSGRKVYELALVPQRLDYADRDLTRLNLDIGKEGFTTVEVQHQPDVYVHMPRGDGQSAVLLYEPNEDVEAWWRVQTLGVIEDVCVLPAATGLEDYVYFVVKRLVNGTTKRFIEKFAARDSCIGGLVNQLADSHIVYSGSPTSQLSLPHLPNTAVVLWGDGKSLGTVTTDAGGLAATPDGAQYSNLVGGLGGAVVSSKATGDDEISTITVGSAYEGMPAVLFADGHPAGSATVSSGVLTLPDNRSANSIVACLGFVAPFMSAKLAYGARMGTALNQKKRIDALGLVAFDLHNEGLLWGQRFDNLDDMPKLDDGVPIPDDKVFSELDRPAVSLPGEWDSDARLCLLAQAPFPAKVGGVVISVDTVERGG